jgi:putative hemolysin
MNNVRHVWITVRKMSALILRALILRALILSLGLAAGSIGCTPAGVEPTHPPAQTTKAPTATEPPAPAAGLANPAAVHCEKQGYKIEIRSDKKGNQYGVCVFDDGTECEEWAYYRGECSPGALRATIAPTTTPVPPTMTPIPATATPAPPSEPAAACAPITVDSGPEYKLWREYTHDKYGFALLLPPGWVAEEIVEPPHHTLRGHGIILWPAKEPRARFQIAFRRQDEEQLIGRTGMGSGDIVEAGTACFIEQEIKRRALVFQGKDMTVIYGSGRGIERGDMVFTLYLDYRGGWEDKTALSKEIQAETDTIVATFQLPDGSGA